MICTLLCGENETMSAKVDTYREIFHKMMIVETMSAKTKNREEDMSAGEGEVAHEDGKLIYAVTTS
jgi:hypothetical protein